MTVNARNGVALSGVSALNGISIAGLTAINGQTISAGGGGGGGPAYSNKWENSTPASTLNLTIAPTAHDVLIAYAVSDSTGTTYTWPSGFTQVDTQTTTTDSQELACAIKNDATGSESSVSIVGSVNCIGGIISISGANNTTPQSTTAVKANNNTGASSPWTIGASINPTDANTLLVAIMGSDTTTSVNAVHSFSDTDTLTWTTRSDLNSGFYNVGVGTASKAASGSTTVTGTGTVGGASAGRAIIVMAIKGP